MAVDTHVFRVSKRIGLVPQTASTPLAVEKELIKNIPESLIHKAHHWLIQRQRMPQRIPRRPTLRLHPRRPQTTRPFKKS